MDDKKISIPLPTIKRLPLYVPVIKSARKQGEQHISSSLIAAKLELEPIQVRKDLAGIGIVGQARVGFNIDELLAAIDKCLGWDNVTDAFVLGAGNLGAALAGYKGFSAYGLNVAALFDSDPKKVGKKVHGKDILPIEKLPGLVKRMHVHIAILTVPESVAQEIADISVISGIRAIWNFTGTKLIVPSEVIVERVDLAASLAVLSSRLATSLSPNRSK